MSDAWEEIQAVKSKRNSLRERLEKRKKEREDILALGSSPLASRPATEIVAGSSKIHPAQITEDSKVKHEQLEEDDLIKVDPELEKGLLKKLNEVTLHLPTTSNELLEHLGDEPNATHKSICNLLQKFATQKIITVKEIIKDGQTELEVTFIEHTKLNALVEDDKLDTGKQITKRKRADSPEHKSIDEEDKKKKEKIDPKANDIMVSINC